MDPNDIVWDIYYGEEVIGQATAATFEEARDRGVEYARMVGHDLAANQVYAIRRIIKRPTSLLRWPDQEEKDAAVLWATRLQMSLNQYIVDAVVAQNHHYREQSAEERRINEAEMWGPGDRPQGTWI